jgi:integrase
VTDAGITIQPKQGWKPKTGDRRTIPISSAAAAALATLPRRARWVVTMPPTKRLPASGQRWTERRLLGELKRVLKKLKLPGKLHTFRHFFISNALMKGIPTATVRSWVGHVDEEIIRLYTHIHDRASQEAMKSLSEANRVVRDPGNGNDEKQKADSSSAQFQHNPKEPKNG